nr:pyroglutamyl-peptidase I [Cellulomonas denverensis]
MLTGFEPFDGQPVNASWAAVREVAAAWPGPVDAQDPAATATPDATPAPTPDAGRDATPDAATLIVRRLPVSFARAPQRLAELLAEHHPDLVICVGEAGGRGRVSVERVAINVQDARIPDEDGEQPVDVPVVAGGPAAHFSSLPVKAALLAAREAGVPAEVSNTAGTFVCNAIAYALADQLTRMPGARGGFVHVPRLPEQVAGGAPALDAARSARGITAVLAAALRHREDLVFAAGTES